MTYTTSAMLREVYTKLAKEQAQPASAPASSSSSSSSALSSITPVATAAIASSGASTTPRRTAPLMSSSIHVFPTPATANATPMSQSMILPADKTLRVAAAPLKSRDDTQGNLPAYHWSPSSTSTSSVNIAQMELALDWVEIGSILRRLFHDAKQKLAKQNTRLPILCNALTELNKKCVEEIATSKLGPKLADPSYEFQEIGQFGLCWMIKIESRDIETNQPITEIWQTVAKWKLAPDEDPSPFTSSDSLRAAMHSDSWESVTVTCICQSTMPNLENPKKGIQDKRIQSFTIRPNGDII